MRILLAAGFLWLSLASLQAADEFAHLRLFRKAEADPAWAEADLARRMEIVVEWALKEPVTSDPVSDRYCLTFLGGPVDWVHFFNLAHWTYAKPEDDLESLYRQWLKEGGEDFERGRTLTYPSAATPDDLPSNALGRLFGRELREAGGEGELRERLEAFIAPLRPVPVAISDRCPHQSAVLGLPPEPTRQQWQRAYEWFTAEPFNLTQFLNDAARRRGLPPFGPEAPSGKAALERAGFRVAAYRGKWIVIERMGAAR